MEHNKGSKDKVRDSDIKINDKEETHKIDLEDEVGIAMEEQPTETEHEEQPTETEHEELQSDFELTDEVPLEKVMVEEEESHKIGLEDKVETDTEEQYRYIDEVISSDDELEEEEELPIEIKHKELQTDFELTDDVTLEKFMVEVPDYRPTIQDGPKQKVKGLSRIKLSRESQKAVSCEVGVNVTPNNPWTYIKKSDVMDDVMLKKERSDFFEMSQKLATYPGNDILIGLIVHPDTDNEFLICTSDDAHKNIFDFVLKQMEEKRKSLIQTTIQPQPWVSKGSEKEIQPDARDSRIPYKCLHEISVKNINKRSDHFDNYDPEDSKDGYVELLPGKETYDNIYRLTLDAAIQAIPESKDTVAQTILHQKKDVSTQYEFPEYTQQDREKFIPEVKNFMNEKLKDILYKLEYNTYIDLFQDVFPDLIINQHDGVTSEYAPLTEYQIFTDVRYSKGKFISHATWHPTWSGIVAVSYVDNIRSDKALEAPNQDEVRKAVFVHNPVLIWSFDDGINPKLILECPREVHVIKFCPFNENILVGGCISGQIIIWDLTDKLQKVEKEEVLTAAQANYRNIFNGMLGWMQKLHEKNYIRPTACSSTEFSSRGCITEISWLTPYWEMQKTGKIKMLEVPEAICFISSAEDGTVNFWDIHAKFAPKGMAPKKRKTRKRPTILETDISLFSHLHLLFRPQFSILLTETKLKRRMPISSLSYHSCKVMYENILPGRAMNSLSRRLYFKALPMKPTETELYNLCLGTVEGDNIQSKWEGYDFETGEAVSSEISKITSTCNVHDYPIIALRRSPFFSDIFLSVGGKTFAIWSEKVKDMPLIWKRSTVRLTGCEWSQYKPGAFQICREDGSIEVWDLSSQSHGPVKIQNISGRGFTSLSPYNLGEAHFLGVADYNGSFRVLHLPETHTVLKEKELEYVTTLINREKSIKMECRNWQEEWNKVNKEFIKKTEEEKEKAKAQKSETLLPLIEDKKKHVYIHEDEELKRLKTKPGKPYLGKIKASEKWASEHQGRKIKSLLQTKKLDLTKTLKEQEKLEKEIEKQKKEQEKERIQNQQRIFEESVKAVLPGHTVIAEKQQEVILEDSLIAKSKFIEDYKNAELEVKEYVKLNPFTYNFNWMKAFHEAHKQYQITN